MRTADLDAPMFSVRRFRGRSLSEQSIAHVSGPTIAAVVGCACVVLGLSVFWKGDASETAAGFWPPAGAALVALVIVPPRRWGWVFAGVLTPTLVGIAFAVAPLTSALLWAIGNCLEPAIAAITLRHFATSRTCTPGRMSLVFFGVGVVLAPMLGAAIGSIGTVVGYHQPWLEVWLQWVLGDGLGVLVVAPLLLVYRTSFTSNRTRYEVSALVVLVIAVTSLTFANIGDNGAALLPYVILVGLVWAGMRFGTAAAAAAGFVVALGANVATSLGDGPFGPGQRAADVVTLQIFLAIALVTSFVVASMASELADRDQVSRLLIHQASHDVVTGLPNGAAFVDRLDAALAVDHPSSGSSIAVLKIVFDGLEKSGDRVGQRAGEGGVRAAAELLATIVEDGDVLARLGGEAFAVLRTGVIGPDAVIASARALHDGVASHVGTGPQRDRLSASVGAALVRSGDPISATDLLHRADLAIDHALRIPGPSVSLFDDALEAHTRRRVEIAEELHGSIQRGEMAVHYQPVVSLETGRVTEFEALARWNNRRFGRVGPDEFIPVAEHDGFINVLGAWVMAQACQQLAVWRMEPRNAELRVAVNVSAIQLSEAAFLDDVFGVLGHAGLPANALTLEITETAVMHESEALRIVLIELRRRGVRLSMDDFGTGYSSMSNLRRTPLDVLKIDRGFVAGLGSIAGDTAIVSSIVDLGHSFGLDVVAEGVETRHQLDRLRLLGCDHGQGFLWSPAVDADAATSMIRGDAQLSSARRAASANDVKLTA